MSRAIALVAAVVGFCVVSGAAAEGSAAAGQTKAVTCAACHGADGNSVNPQWPSLAGQHASYIAAQLAAFKSQERVNVLMNSQAMALTEQDMADLAAYFEAQAPVQRAADPALVRHGERLYRGGSKDSQASACIACHGPTGRGNPASDFPRVSGQHATYIAAQLRAYASGERPSGHNRMMNDIATRLSEEDIVALASYIQGLR